MDRVMALQDTLHHLQLLIEAVAKDLKKVSRGNRSAAQRVRVGTISLQKVGRLFRKESLHAERRSNPKRLRRRARKQKRL